ncbi:MAG: ATP-dependent zinc metalloprotease FtsH [Patescibacteria group bacterium]|jgi:cell division protease FtsH
MLSKPKDEHKKKLGNSPKKEDLRPRSLFSNVFFYVFLLLALYLLFGAGSSGALSTEKRPISELINLIREDKVQDVKISGNSINVMLKDGTKFATQKEADISFDQILKNNDLNPTKISGEIVVEHKMAFDQILSLVLTFGLPLFVIFFIFKQMRGANNDIMSFGRSRARLFSKDKSKITFADVAGAENAKTEMMEIVDFLKNPEKYSKLGARIPKGILLIGPSGVGKTLLAKAIAGEANVPFFSVAGSEFMEMLVGVGSARARDLFLVAKENQPSLIFIDEIDAIGRQRGMGIGGGHDEREQTLNQILIEMDGFDPRTAVIVLAATNRPDMLDPALVRPGRFDRTITIPLPDLKEREEIIKIHMRGKPFEENVAVDRIAKKTVGFSGADIENMLNESAILAARGGKDKISDAILEEAALKVTLGSERKTLQTEEERKMTAYHEAGHALVAANLADMDPVYRISIVARGASLGHTSLPPERDRYNETMSRLNSIISTMLAGRAAEEIVYNELTVGASDDIEKATEIARKMVTEYGMSPLGPVSYEGKEGRFWLAKQMGEGQLYSEDMAAKIDAEVKKIIDKAYERSREIIIKNRPTLDRVTLALLEKETLDQDEFKALLLQN